MNTWQLVLLQNPFKILNIVPDDRFSGPIRRVVDVAYLLNQNYGLETTVCFPQGHGNGPEVAESKGISAIRVPYTKIPHLKDITSLLNWLIRLPKDVRTFCRVIAQTDPDMVHLNSAFFLSPALAAKIMRKPLLWHLNDTMAGRVLSRILGVLVRLLANKVAAAALAVGRHYGLRDNQFEVLYAPVDVTVFTHRNRTKDEPHDGQISMIANWNQVKGLDLFVKVVDELRKLHPEVSFHLAGAKLDSQKQYAARIELLIDQRQVGAHIVRYGFVDNIPDFLYGMDIHILTSISEACPMTVLEGMAAGLPVVATDVGGVREILVPDTTEKSGLVVPVNDCQAMARAIVYLLEHPGEAKTMGANGRKRAENLFSLTHCAQRHRNLYSALLMDSNMENCDKMIRVKNS